MYKYLHVQTNDTYLSAIMCLRNNPATGKHAGTNFFSRITSKESFLAKSCTHVYTYVNVVVPCDEDICLLANRFSPYLTC